MQDFFNNPILLISTCLSILIPCGGAVFTAVLAYIIYAPVQKSSKTWQEFAQKYSFKFESGNLLFRENGVIKGMFEGREITIYTKTGRRSPTVTVFIIGVDNPDNFFLSLSIKSLYGNFYRTSGGQAVQGLADLEGGYSIMSTSPETAKDILRSAAKIPEKIKTIDLLELLIKDRYVQYSIRGNLTNEAALLYVLRMGVETAQALDGKE